MRHRSLNLAAASMLAIVWCAAANAQTPAPPPAGWRAPSGIVVASPTYTSILMEIAVNKPAADVWKRVGKFCDIGEWLRIPCTITSGKDGEVGAIRSVANEVLVGKTELSYTYTQPVREGRPYNLYHGTLEARPVTATTSKLVYTLFFDNSMLADDAARDDGQGAADRAVHAGAREHEDSRRRRHAAAGAGARPRRCYFLNSPLMFADAPFGIVSDVQLSPAKWRGEIDDLPDVRRGVGDRAVERLDHEILFAADRDRAAEILGRQRFDRSEQDRPRLLPPFQELRRARRDPASRTRCRGGDPASRRRR